VARKQDYFGRGRLLFGHIHHLDTVYITHHNIGDNNIEWLALRVGRRKHGAGRLAIGGLGYLIALFMEEEGDNLAHIVIVFYQENMHGHKRFLLLVCGCHGYPCMAYRSCVLL